jgi:hypothetical protein
MSHRPFWAWALKLRPHDSGGQAGLTAFEAGLRAPPLRSNARRWLRRRRERPRRERAQPRLPWGISAPLRSGMEKPRVLACALAVDTSCRIEPKRANAGKSCAELRDIIGANAIPARGALSLSVCRSPSVVKKPHDPRSVAGSPTGAPWLMQPGEWGTWTGGARGGVGVQGSACWHCSCK